MYLAHLYLPSLWLQEFPARRPCRLRHNVQEHSQKVPKAHYILPTRLVHPFHIVLEGRLVEETAEKRVKFIMSLNVNVQDVSCMHLEVTSRFVGKLYVLVRRLIVQAGGCSLLYEHSELSGVTS
jgi:hypothetical protein